jgi:hypothetical protein
VVLLPPLLKLGQQVFLFGNPIVKGNHPPGLRSMISCQGTRRWAHTHHSTAASTSGALVGSAGAGNGAVAATSPARLGWRDASQRAGSLRRHSTTCVRATASPSPSSIGWHGRWATCWRLFHGSKPRGSASDVGRQSDQLRHWSAIRASMVRARRRQVLAGSASV